MKPKIRRALTCSVSGALGLSAAAEAVAGRVWSAHGLAAAGAAAFLIPTMIRNCRWNGPIVTSFAPAGRDVWLTIDDGPDPDETPAILETLSKHNAKALFFQIGKRVADHPDLAAAVVNAGHLVGNHTQTHPVSSFWGASPRRARREISLCSDTILEATGARPRFFRAPVGFANPFVHAAAEQAGLRMVGWSANGFDGIPHHPERVLERIMKVLRPGSVILMHENRLSRIKPGTRARTLDTLLGRLHGTGYRTVLPAP